MRARDFWVGAASRVILESLRLPVGWVIRTARWDGALSVGERSWQFPANKVVRMKLRIWGVSLIALSAALAAACGAAATATPLATFTPIPSATAVVVDTNRTVQEGDDVAVHYTGTLDSGEQFDSSVGGQPLEFTVGAGQMIPGFDAAVRGMRIGEKKTARLEAADAYGEPRDDLIIEVPREQLPEDIVVGEQGSMGGIPVTILDITDEIVRLDGNHRLAGETLTFEIEIVSIS